MPHCPHLPSAPLDLRAEHTRQWREECGVKYQLACLEYAQSHWLAGKPAQAILQLNKSFIADAELHTDFCPYAALRWILRQPANAAFLGNPVRHFQHLATRMSGPRAELRKWRAWACFHIAEAILPAEPFPRDQLQITREKLLIPDLPEVLAQLPAAESTRVQNALFPATPAPRQ